MSSIVSKRLQARMQQLLQITWSVLLSVRHLKQALRVCTSAGGLSEGEARSSIAFAFLFLPFSFDNNHSEIEVAA